MKKHYNTMSFSAISIEPAGSVLLQSGELGARIYFTDVTVDTWKDNPGTFDAYIDPTNPDNPIEF